MKPARRPEHLAKAKAFDLLKDDRLRQLVRVTCDLCGATDTHGLSTLTMPPAAIAKWFRNRGWDVPANGKRATCPGCRKPTPGLTIVPDAPPEPEAPPPPESPPLPPAPPPTEPEEHDHPMHDAGQSPESPDPATAPPSARAFQQQRLLFQLLEAHFDVTGHCYTEGYSDDRCATETGLALSFVRQTRENAFGPLVDPGLRRLHTKLKELRRRQTEELNTLASMVEDTRQRHDEETAKLLAEVEQHLAGRKV